MCLSLSISNKTHNTTQRNATQLFDLRASKVRWEGNAGNGITGLEFDRKVRRCVGAFRGYIYVTCLSSVGLNVFPCLHGVEVAAAARLLMMSGPLHQPPLSSTVTNTHTLSLFLYMRAMQRNTTQCNAPQEIEMNKLVATTLEAGIKVYDLRCAFCLFVCLFI